MKTGFFRPALHFLKPNKDSFIEDSSDHLLCKICSGICIIFEIQKNFWQNWLWKQVFWKKNPLQIAETSSVFESKNNFLYLKNWVASLRRDELFVFLRVSNFAGIGHLGIGHLWFTLCGNCFLWKFSNKKLSRKLISSKTFLARKFNDDNFYIDLNIGCPYVTQPKQNILCWSFVYFLAKLLNL